MKKAIINNLIIITILFFTVNQYNLSKITASIGFASAAESRIVLENNSSDNEIISAVLPQEKDTVRPYSWKGSQVTLSARTPGNGYDMLVDMEKSIPESKLDADQKKRYNNLVKSIYHPCCDVAIGNCGCKHAVAARGVVKYALLENWDDNRILDEVFLWNRYWWPKHYATAAVYLNSQGTNPADISARDWLSNKLSTLRVGRKMKAALGR